VTDIVLRGRIDGWEVAKRARQIDPEFPVIDMSGAAAAEWPFKGVPNSIMLSSAGTSDRRAVRILRRAQA
jgi:hypothetical protein